MLTNDKLREECAIFGASINNLEAAGVCYNGLLTLQHRGQEGAGIAVIEENKIMFYKNVGLVSEVFNADVLKKLPKGRVALGHNRYSTTGSNVKENVGPFITEFLTGRIATAHNGNVTNAKDIKDTLQNIGLNFDATSDSEVVSSLIAYYITKEEDFVKGVTRAGQMLKGAFSLIIGNGKGDLIALRDPNGYRPLCIGESETGMVISSESCAVETCGFDFLRDVKPGELVLIRNGKIEYSEIVLTEKENGAGLCIFEYVYFSRPDSIVDGLSVYESRFNMGAELAKEYPVDADIVCGVPDSGLEAAMGYAAESGIPLKSGFVKNRYIGRSFIYPTQSQRDTAVRLKLNPLITNVKGQRIVLVDDSIVRGTTSARIVKALRHAGAKEVHMRISSPPFKHTCHYGTDIDKKENLIANQKTLDEICQSIGADSLGYISVKGLKTACQKSGMNFCTYCFTGHGEDLDSIDKSNLEG
ncbi:MAG: amidophosphoribosyltransferase [Clostridia bacterium]